MAAASQHRCVFVGNIPYDVSEEQLVQICEEVGPVASFRLVTDKETGKPKGYGFCEYKDEETALSARRNLQGYEINGRQLRVDFAENDKGTDRSREGRGGPGQVPNSDQLKLGPVDASNQQQIGTFAAASAATIMARALGGSQVGIRSNPNGQLVIGNDPLTLHLAQMSRNQLFEVLQQFKEMATQNKKLAQELLLSNTQLSKAFLQVLIILRLVPPQVLQQPNIRQGSTSTSAVHYGSELLVSAQSHFNRPPLPQNKLDSSVFPKVDQGQISAGVPILLPPNRSSTSHFQQVNQTQQIVYSEQSGVTEHVNMNSQPVLSSTIRPQIQSATSSPATHIMQSHVVQNTKQTGSSHLDHLSQSVSLNGNLHTESSARPAVGDPRYQFGSTSQGTLQIKGQEVYRSTPVNAKLAQRATISKNLLQDLKISNVTPGIREATSCPLKQVKLEDARGASLPVSNRLLKQVKLEEGSGVPARVVGFPPKQVKLEEGSIFNASTGARNVPNLSLSSSQNIRPGVQPVEKQTLQLPPGMDPSILEQVLKLTPEQLSFLPPDQQQEVIQLQKMLSNSI